MLPSLNDSFEGAEISGNDARNIRSILILAGHRLVFQAWKLDTRRRRQVAFSQFEMLERKCNRLMRALVSSVERGKKCNSTLQYFFFSRPP